jgi:hypothetical protein
MPNRTNSLKQLSFLVVILVTATTAFGIPRQKIQEFSGRVVAYNNWFALTCLNGNAYYWVIVRLEHAGKTEPYIVVHFSLPCGAPAKWLNDSSVKKFRVIRNPLSDTTLDKPGTEREQWTHVPGTEGETLPFGVKIPGYDSADLPPRPVV